ncbi:hypothetical protein [Actinophytocola sp.]|uniref:hypothetical protein n=1 Tax=Actinophytocola sp. TaxID=1872138 RepID=UPI002ED5A1F3
MFKRVAILAALAAGTVLLTACNASMSASDGKTGATVDVNLATDGDQESEPVDCGEVEVNGSTQKLIAVGANGGVVGCTEAFNVLDEYLTKGTTQLSDGWACAPDDASVACVKGDAQDPEGLGFHTEAIDATTPKPVECGEVDVDGNKHMLIAEPTVDGVVGCTEAFNILDEYLTIPAAQRGASLDGTDLSDGWHCTTDDGETASIGCVQGSTYNDITFAFGTRPM